MGGFPTTEFNSERIVKCLVKSIKETTLFKSAGANDPASTFISIGGIKLRYKSAGTGEQILLLHGWGGSIESFGLVFEDLVRSYAVTAFDFPGHGESELPPRAWGGQDFSELTLQFMDALRLKSPNIIAHSFGGRVTIRLAATNPDRVSKLILVNSAGVILERTFKYHARLLAAKVGKLLFESLGPRGDGLRRWLYSHIASKDYLAAGPLRSTFVRIVNEDITHILPQIKARTLLIWGEHDTETPLSSAHVMERLIPNARLVILKHAGHYSYIDQFGKFRLIVQRFLREK